MSAPLERGALSLRESARVLGVDRNVTLHRLIEMGAVRAIPWLGGIRIARAEIDRVLREGLPPLDARAARRYRPRRDHGKPLGGAGDRIRAIRVEDE